MGAKMFIRTPRYQKNLSPQKYWFGLCENAWFPWQPVEHFTSMGGGGVYLKIGDISDALYPRPLNMVPSYSLDSCLLSSSNYLICILMNINENLKKNVKIIEKNCDLHIKSVIS